MRVPLCVRVYALRTDTRDKILCFKVLLLLLLHSQTEKHNRSHGVGDGIGWGSRVRELLGRYLQI